MMGEAPGTQKEFGPVGRKKKNTVFGTMFSGIPYLAFGIPENTVPRTVNISQGQQERQIRIRYWCKTCLQNYITDKLSCIEKQIFFSH